VWNRRNSRSQENIGGYVANGAELPAQLALLSDDSAKPEGLRYQPDFISGEEEQELIARISGLTLSRFTLGAQGGGNCHAEHPLFWWIAQRSKGHSAASRI
jgi:hypothetical protein